MVSAASYYFSSCNGKEGSASVTTGIKFAYSKHAGSLAFGSLLHTLIKILQIIVENLADAAEEGDGASGAGAVFACCARCCVSCLENLIEYLNTTAYAYMAVSGDNYCTSAWNGFLLHIKHCAKFSFAMSFASMFITMGKLFITLLNCVSYFVIIKWGTKNIDDVSSIWPPLIIIFIISFMFAHIFLCMFDEATMATLQCLAIDMDLNEGKPQYGSPSFHEKLEKVYGKSEEVKLARGYRAYDQ